MMRSDLTDIEVIYQHHTEKAVCVRLTEGEDAVWLPLDLVEIDGHGREMRRGTVVTLTGPESLLTDKGLL